MSYKAVLTVADLQSDLDIGPLLHPVGFCSAVLMLAALYVAAWALLQQNQQTHRTQPNSSVSFVNR